MAKKDLSIRLSALLPFFGSAFEDEKISLYALTNALSFLDLFAPNNVKYA